MHRLGSYLEHGTNYSTMVWPGTNYNTIACPVQIYFEIVCLLIFSVHTLSLKDPLIGNDTIHLEPLLTVGVICWTNLSGCWQIKNKKNSPSTISNPYCSMFRLHTVARYIYIYIERERERKRESVRVYEQTQRDSPPTAQPNSLNANFWPLTDWQLFQIR